MTALAQRVTTRGVQILLVSLLAVLAVATVERLVHALDGSGAVAEWSGDPWFAGAGWLALVVGGFALLFALSGPHAASLERSPLLPLLSLTAAAFVVAQDLTWDGYYGVAEVRYIDHGMLTAGHLVALVGIAVVVAVVSRRRPTAALPLTAGVFWLSAFATMYSGSGH